MKKILVISAWAPPMGGGSPIALAKRIRSLPKDSYVLLTSERRHFLGKPQSEWLPASYYFLGESEPHDGSGGLATPQPVRFGKPILPAAVRLLLPIARPIRDMFQLMVRLPAVRRQAVSVIGREQPDVVLATSDDGIFLISAYLAARATGTPLYLLLLDIYARNNYSWVKRAVARIYEPRMLRSAEVVIVTNDATRKYYQDLYGIRAEVLVHPATNRTVTRARARSPRSVIAYTGSIYWAQRDALQMLVRALDLLPSTRLLLVSELDEQDLRRLGLWSAKVDTAYSDVSHVHELQVQADILYLPLAFRSPSPKVIQTATPGKMVEYLVSGVPILVHAPDYSYVAQDARASGWALVVDQPQVTPLVQAVQALLDDQELRQRLVANAFAVAHTRHNEQRIADRFKGLFE